VKEYRVIGGEEMTILISISFISFYEEEEDRRSLPTFFESIYYPFQLYLNLSEEEEDDIEGRHLQEEC
jgi:hypothetical protein